MFVRVSILALSVIAGAADAQEQLTRPPGASACWAFARRLDAAWFRLQEGSTFAVDTAEKATRFIEYTNRGYFEVEEPVGGPEFIPAEPNRVRAATATLGYDFNPARWEVEPGASVRIYSVDIDDDYAEDLVIERKKNGIPCSDFEFWRVDQSTRLLVPIPSPEGWDSCKSEEKGQSDFRFLATFDGMLTAPIRAAGRGLEADFHVYRLRQSTGGASRPGRPGSHGASADNELRVPAACRVRLERRIVVNVKGPETCADIGASVRLALIEGAYAIDGSTGKLPAILESRNPELELNWPSIGEGKSEAELKAALIELRLSSEEAGMLIAQFTPGAPTLWVVPRLDYAGTAIALITGITPSGSVQAYAIHRSTAGVWIERRRRVFFSSERARAQFQPLTYDGRAFLLESETTDSDNLKLSLTPLGGGADEGCRIELSDRGMQSSIEYATTAGP